MLNLDIVSTCADHPLMQHLALVLVSFIHSMSLSKRNEYQQIGNGWYRFGSTLLATIVSDLLHRKRMHVVCLNDLLQHFMDSGVLIAHFGLRYRPFFHSLTVTSTARYITEAITAPTWKSWVAKG